MDILKIWKSTNLLWMSDLFSCPLFAILIDNFRKSTALITMKSH